MSSITISRVTPFAWNYIPLNRYSQEVAIEKCCFGNGSSVAQKRSSLTRPHHEIDTIAKSHRKPSEWYSLTCLLVCWAWLYRYGAHSVYASYWSSDELVQRLADDKASVTLTPEQ